MHINYTWICFLLVSCTGSAHCACRWLQRYDSYNSECIKLLQDMGGDVKDSQGLDRCSKTPRSFISDLYTKSMNATDEQKIAFLHKATHRIVKLLSSSHVTDTWDKTKLDNLLNVLNQQATELGACVTQGPSRRFAFRKELRKPFHDLKQCLIEKNYSQSSWEHVKKEVKHHLDRLLYLANSMLMDY